MIFGIDQDDTLENDMDEPEQETGFQELEDGARQWDRQSPYVEVPERAINHIIDEEKHLFTDDELSFVRAIGKLECMLFLVQFPSALADGVQTIPGTCFSVS